MPFFEEETDQPTNLYLELGPDSICLVGTKSQCLLNENHAGK